ncbi:S-layer homology domain-containing protein [Veillonella agrestimuris]|uniref:S-layer homology domain-containing protein n=1 Tax=Veillonella agrestimuris TaxID=2941340 RepID=UPI00203FCA07|nr:S-layer homology domain-containing protein [Veillonella agrestimuris]
MKKHCAKLAALLLLTPTIAMADSTGTMTSDGTAILRTNYSYNYGYYDNATNNAIIGNDNTKASSFTHPNSGVTTGVTGAVVIGENAESQGTNTIVIGKDAKATGSGYGPASDSVAIGVTSHAEGSNGVAIGSNSHSSNLSATAVGSGSYALGSYSTAIGENAYTGFQSTALGSNAKASEWSTALGKSTNASGRGAVAIGNGAQATGNDSFAANFRSVASGDGAVAIGWNAHAEGYQSTAVADGSKATSMYSSAFGTRSTAGATYATAVGDSAYAVGERATAIGKSASTSLANSVALGAYSLANRDAGSRGYDPLTSTTSTATDSTWQSTRAAVSIGNDTLGITRQITGVAAGSADTDAVNVAQLKRAVEANTKNVEVVAGDNVTVTSATAGNATTYTVSAKDTITTVSAADNSVTVNNDGNHNYTVAVSDEIKNQINNNTININKNAENIANNTSRINRLDNRIDKVGAGAAALSALHPLDFDPDDKWNFAAGYGNYSGENAMAVGAFYRPNEDTMFSVAGSMGNGENMVNAGVSFKLGQASNVTRSRVAMAQEILDLKADNKDLRQQLADVNDKLNRVLGILDTTKQAMFPDVPENHWAYEYIAVLAGNGIIEGYPDGMFKGNMAMTRYEFAAMLYRALQNGAKQDATMNKLMDEFEPELRQIRMDRFRVDRISGEDNDRHKVNRVRVNSDNDKANNVYKDAYGNIIKK